MSSGFSTLARKVTHREISYIRKCDDFDTEVLNVESCFFLKTLNDIFASVSRRFLK